MRASSPRRLSPLLLLAAALMALAVLFAPGAQPAQASSIWSARLTVQEVISGVTHGCANALTGKECSTASTLTDDTFTFDGVDYVLEEISAITGGTFGLKLDKAIPDTLDTLVLYVGGDARLVFADGTKTTGTNTNDTITWSSTMSWSEGDVVGLALTSERLPSPLRRVSLSVSPNPVAEGGIASVTVTLLTPEGDQPGTLGSDVTIPFTVTAGTAESGDLPAISSTTITAGSTVGRLNFVVAQDTDADDETFTVALDAANSAWPSGVRPGPITSVQVRITDDESASPGTLSVDTGFGNPACGSTVSVTSETPETALVLSPAPSAEEPTEYRVLADMNGSWLAAVPILASGSSVFTSLESYARLREAYPGFTGFEFRLSDHPEVNARCTWTFGARPAQAPTAPIWSGTLTVKELGSERGCHNARLNKRCSETDVLTSYQFRHGATTYSIREISWATDVDEMIFNIGAVGAAVDDLTVLIHGANNQRWAFSLKDATHGSGSHRHRHIWTDAGLTWSEGDTVSLSLTDAPTVSLSADPGTVDEGSPVTITVSLSKALSSRVTIPLAITSGTAEAGDYSAPGSITISAGATTGTGTIATRHDADTRDETFTVSLGTLPPELAAGSPSSIEITISDDDLHVPSVSRIEVDTSLQLPAHQRGPYCYIGAGNSQTEYVRYPDGRIAETQRASDAIRSMLACD